MILTSAATCALSMTLTADVRMPKIFGDNMVLQREIPVPVWGWAGKGEKISVRFAGQEKTAITGEDGKWMVKLDPLRASKEPSELIVSFSAGNPSSPEAMPGKSRQLKIKNVLVGEVWVCSGQSNMAFDLKRALNAKDEIEKAANPLIRNITIKNTPSPKKLDDIAQGKWDECSPQTAGGFTAVGYFFAKKLVEELDIPVGLIDSSWGGTPIEAWICLEGFRAGSEFDAIIKQVEEWGSTGETALSEKQSAPDVPTSPKPPAGQRLPTKLYNSMISPLVPYAVRGVIWYQGEANSADGIAYLPKMKALIGGWRQLWKQGDFPFYYVQLPNHKNSDPDKPEGGDGYSRLREAQFQSLSIKNTGMAVIIDVGEAENNHPVNKQDVGARLALLALANDYGKKVESSGPLYKSFKGEGNKIRIEFDHAENGLLVGEKKGLAPAKEIKDGKLGWIVIAGDERKFYFADAVIDGKALVVSSDKVTKPVAVRYHFTANPEGLHLYNREGLPATPFRTDAW